MSYTADRHRKQPRTRNNVRAAISARELYREAPVNVRRALVVR